MSKIAIDTNIMIYAFDEFYPEKKNVSLNIIADNPVFCSQNLSEFINVCLRRLKLPKTTVAKLMDVYLQQCLYYPVSKVSLLNVSKIIAKYDFQLFDAIIVSSALEAGCTILYSEDMHHNLVVENTLNIINPFI